MKKIAYVKMFSQLPPSEHQTQPAQSPSLLISGYSRGLGDQGRGESHASLPHSGGVGGTNFRVAGLRDHGDGLHKNRAHCTNAWLVFTRKEEGSHLDFDLFWGRRGKKEPEDRKGPGWTLSRDHSSSNPEHFSHLPSTYQCPRGGGASLGACS